MKSKNGGLNCDSQVEGGSDNENNNNITTTKLRFWPRVWADLSDRELLPLKLLFFLKSATVYVLYPYLTLHIKSLGLDADKAGLSNALTVISVVGQPLAGVISDKLGNFKLLLSVITFLTTIPALLLLTIPLARETIDLPAHLTFSLQCDSQFYVDSINFNSNNNNNISHGNMTFGNLSTALTFTSINQDECSPLNDTQAPSLSLLRKLQIYPMLQVVQCGHICDEPRDDSSPGQGESYAMMSSLPVLAGKKYYIPGEDRKFFVPFEYTSESTAVHGMRCLRRAFHGEEDICTAPHFGAELEPSHGSVQNIYLENSLASENNNLTPSVQFRIVHDDDQDHKDEMQHCERVNSEFRENCQSACITLLERKSFCSNTKIEKVYDETLTFWLYNVLRVFLGLLSSTSWIMYEGAVLAIMKERKGDYGIQRASSFIAAIIAAPLAGFMISYFEDFRPAFYLYAALQVVCTILTMKIHLEFKTPAVHVFASLWRILKKYEVVCLMVAVLCSGTAWGFLESFLFWFLQNLGGSGLLMGLTITVGGLAGLPFLIVNKPIITKFGHVNIVALGLLFYGIRLVGYSFINDPWMCLPLEALEAFTSSLAITAANTFAAELADKNTVVSVQGIIGALYYTIGRSIGSLIGGYLIQCYGERETYQIIGVGAFISGVIYMLFNFFHNLHQRRAKRFKNINLPKSSQDENKLHGLKFDGGYVGPFSITDSVKDDH